MKVRTIDPKAPIHSTVAEHFELPLVLQCAGSGPYRPAALAGYDDFNRYYAKDTEKGA